jgi:hypothetical protein
MPAAAKHELTAALESDVPVRSAPYADTYGRGDDVVTGIIAFSIEVVFSPVV